MGNISLIVLLLLLLIVFYKSNKQNIISPSLVATFMFTIGSIVAFINEDYWDQHISYVTVFTICSALLFIHIGEIVGRKVHLKKPYKPYNDIHYDKEEIKLLRNNGGVITTLFLSAFMMAILVIYILHLRRVVLNAGFSGGIASIISNIKMASIEESTISMSSLLSQGYQLMKCIGYYFIYLYVYNIVFYKKKLLSIYIIPSLIFFFSTLLSPGRLGIFKVFIFVLIVWITLYEKKEGKPLSIKLRTFKFVFLSSVGFIFLFRFLTVLRNSDVNISSYLSTYMGGSIVAFDIFLTGNAKPNNELENFRAIVSYISALGFNMPKVTYSLYPVYWYSVTGELIMTNVFTALRRYIHDLGYGGMYIVCFFLGVVYSWGYNRVKSKKLNHLSLVFYASYFYPIVNLFFEENFLNEVLSINTLLNLIYYYFMFRFFTVYLDETITIE